MKHVLGFLLVLSACGEVAATDAPMGPQSIRIGPLPPGNTEIGRVVRGPASARYCGNIGFVDLGSAVDGPAYFFRRSDGRILGRCGGYCWAPEQRERCARECPPREWTCGARAASGTG